MYPEIFIPLDFYFADLHTCNENERIFYAALMATSRQGHLCLDIDAIDLPLTEEWKEKIREGSKTAVSPYTRRFNHLFYLEKNYTYETSILERIQELSFSLKLPSVSINGLTSEQHSAIQTALSHSISIIEGGPGTGKSFLTSHLVRLGGSQVILAAPTGKAALRLKQFNPTVTCGTLHAILGIKSHRDLEKGSSFLQADLIIVDESSMLDAKLFAYLLNSLQKGTRLILLGDANQLPPVESGSLFGDLVDLLPTAHLKQCLRSDAQPIINRARAIFLGEKIEPDYPLSEEFILKQAAHFYQTSTSFCILSPLREGPFGVEHLNEKILRLFLQKTENTLAVPILITKTDYALELYNGEMGLLWRTRDKLLYAEFGSRKIPIGSLPSYELGYVLSVHKSQGNEFDHVLVIIPPGSEIFGREVLYTAVTRAKHSVILCSDSDTLEKTVSSSSRRRSGIRFRLCLQDVL